MISVLALCALAPAVAEEEAAAAKTTTVVMKTNLGSIEIELFDDKAPITVKNFLSYVEKEAYNGTIFHRVIKGFMIQGGGFGPDLEKRPTDPPIKNEADNGLKNEVGTIAMARTGVVDSATSQFFINTVDNKGLDHAGPGPRFGYAVFGKVTSGMDVVRKIEASATRRNGPHANFPVQTVTIESVTVK
jgi:peptidyl-prolyl cis-trans isomerase A (cyclophilin A)